MSDRKTDPCVQEASVETRALVIGAGLSGLAAARALAERGIPVTILEAGDRVAEPWRARHPQLRLNIHRRFAALPGRRPPSDDGPFIRRDVIAAYLEAYAAELETAIHYGTEVQRVERSRDGWTVATNRRRYRCQHLIVATGRERVPHIPDWPGADRFRGEIVHAAELGDIARYAGKRVLVVGAGNSGSDVLNHLARIEPAEVRVSVRHGPSIVPTRLFGFPLHRLANLFALLPAWILDPVFAATQRLVFGDLRRFGLRSHPDGGGTRLLRDGVTFAMDDGFVAAIKAGRLKVVAETVGFDRDKVRLADGAEAAADIVICATGYRSDLEPLFGRFGVLGADGRPRHPMGEVDRANPGLWFTGYRPVFQGYFHAAGVAAQRIASAVAKGAPVRSTRGGRSLGDATSPNGARRADIEEGRLPGSRVAFGDPR